MTFTQGIYIDGILFDVPLVSVKRTFSVLDKTAERDEEAGDLYREILGVYANFTLNFGIIDNDELYSKLIDKLTEPVNYHEFSVPITRGNFEFIGYISEVSDEILKIYEDTTTFQNLSCRFTAKKPFRTP